MPTVQRTVTTTAPPTRVLPYLLDFENAPEWDSGTVTCELLSGDGSPARSGTTSPSSPATRSTSTTPSRASATTGS